MRPAERYKEEAPTPQEPTLHETIIYNFNEVQRRAYHSTHGLTDEDINIDPGHGAWSIGEIVKHQLDLVRFILETLQPGTTRTLKKPDIGEPGSYKLKPMLEYRERLNERFHKVLTGITTDQLMQRRPDMPPEHWAEWPILMRILRPLTDLATHTGQVNYARRQLDKPVGRNR